MNRWTAADEAKLQELQKRKKQLHDDAMIGVTTVAQLLLSAGTGTGPAGLAQALAQYAERVRDALDPFDSGSPREEAPE